MAERVPGGVTGYKHGMADDIGIDPSNLDETAIPLSRLQELFAAIPARRLVLILDCCFAGGIGPASVFV